MSVPGPGFPLDVEVAIVSHNGRSTLGRVLSALDAAGVPRDRISVYDIASTDDTRTWLEAGAPGIRVVPLSVNAGPNPARNLALTSTAQPFLLLLDSDAYVRPDTIQHLRAAIGAVEDAAMAVPVVVHDQQPERIQYAGGALHFICEATSPWQDRFLAERGSQRAAIGSAPGLCCLVHVETARAVGLFDERYFMGKEDGEFCFRLRAAGHTIVEDPAAVVQHASRPRSTWLYRYQIRNRWHFMLMNYEMRTLLALAPAFAIHEPLQFAVLAARGEAGAWWRAVRDLARWLPALAQDRRLAAARRRRHDRELLTADPLVVRADITGGGSGARAKRGYDRLLAWYWRLVGTLGLPRT
jgi:GT2 family glycosyltransferase